MKSFFIHAFIVFLFLIIVLGKAYSQSDESSTYRASSLELSNKTFTFNHIDAPPHISSIHIFEVAFASDPGVVTAIITPCMRGGTCGVPQSQSGTTSTIISIPGIWDLYKVQVTWTNSESSVILNITGIHSLT